MAILVWSFMSASQQTSIMVKEICKRTWNLARTASSFFFVPLILHRSCTYDRAFWADDLFACLVTSANTESDISVSSLNIECQHHSTKGCGREIHTCGVPQYSSSIVLMILLNQSD